MVSPRRLFFPVAAALAAMFAAAAAAAPFEFRDGDRVVLIGSTLVEREAAEGYLETRLTAAFPGRRISFRNLGWSGDTVWGHARAGFDTEVQGFERLVNHVKSLDPTVLIVGYGNVESFAGDAGLKPFIEGLNRLLDTLELKQTRLIFLSPTPHEALPPPLPDPSLHNAELKEYAEAIRDVAARRKGVYVDLLSLLDRPHGRPPLTDNGIHFTPYGYGRLCEAVAYGLEIPLPLWRLDIDLNQGSIDASGVKLTQLNIAGGECRFDALDAALPACAAAAPSGDEFRVAPQRLLRVSGLPPGMYALEVDGQLGVEQATAQEWAQGVALTHGPSFVRAAALRQAIVEKNQLYFHRWRPQNDTYLFGFRKHEQGNNAVEIPQFDPLVAEKEKQIAELAVPRPHAFRLVHQTSGYPAAAATASTGEGRPIGEPKLAVNREAQP